MKHSEYTVDPEDVRQAMRQWATGVTVVTAQHAGERHGMTVSSFTSVSLSPPLVLVSIEVGTRTHEMIQESGLFGVTILHTDQWQISDRFAGRETEIQDRFDNLQTFTLSTGVDHIAGGLVNLDCSVVSEYPAGSHTLFIGEVLAVQINQGDAPLIYYDRAYRQLCDYSPT